jgi:hypothetical protein
MCQRENYMFSLYLLAASISIFTSGIFTIMSMGKVHKDRQLKEQNEITKKNQLLPTNTLVETEPRTQLFQRVVF